MNNKNFQIGIIGAIFLLITSLSTFAAGNTAQVVITSQPSYLPANYNYTVTFQLLDSANRTMNYTAKYYDSGVNVQNVTATNVSSTPGNNSYSVTFWSTTDVAGDVVSANITTVENGNVSVSAYNVTDNLNVSTSTTVLVASDTLDGLSNTGGYIGDMMGNMVGGIFKFILLMGLAGAIVVLIVALIYTVKDRGVGGFLGKK